MITGEQVRAARRRNGNMTQGELAALMGMGKRTITGWENNAVIPLDKQARLAEILGIESEVSPQVRAHIDPLAELTDSQLVAELARRLGELRTYAMLTEAARAATVTPSNQGGALPAGSRGPELPGSRLRNDVVSSGAGIPTDIPAESPISTDIGGSRMRNKPARNVTKGPANWLMPSLPPCGSHAELAELFAVTDAAARVRLGLACAGLTNLELHRGELVHGCAGACLTAA